MESIPGPFAEYSFIPEPEKFLASLRIPIPPYVRINTLKTPEEKAVSLLKGEGMDLVPVEPIRPFYRAGGVTQLGNTKAYALGYIYPQGLSSSLPVLALAPKPEHLVLDMCAAPGGKTGHMAQLMGDMGTIVANDRLPGRITALTANLKRLGVTNTVVTMYRADNFPPGRIFDRILLDAPCSGEGRYRLTSDGLELMHRRTGKTDLPAIQKGMIIKTFDLLKDRGIMVYSTCTLNPEENEAVVSYLLNRREAAVMPWEPPLPWSHGLTGFKEKKYDPMCRNCRRFYPHQINSVGFFVAKILRK